ncbi:hypothetical protein [Ralstonia solanacearum]|uniref:hypothetical protein n=1 Tax=Ralstonia solanacearum TaxID=305 RepID=UPI0020A35FEB|nr:hypothetical protein [Ralstonia solanacearum]
MDPGELLGAAQATFTRRGLTIPEEIPAGLSDTFARDATKQQQWAAFLKKNRLPAMDLAQVVELLRNAFQQLQAR